VGDRVQLLVTFLIPGSAALPGTAFLHEQMKVHHFAGVILIALGLARVDRRIATKAARYLERCRWRTRKPVLIC
jgi:threonine/homoserine efflux transporter RhtA